ncbi:FRG domain-containing protein [Tindallia californiensis]|uniref:FRG domain-containing protein n=1 Tax=Tindallia californiensis TaxID=159292 RepID=A0A1H3PQ83_9FIRM|nr:FRG domain-containing protein [Tindallia californiensis]SDZ03422.1 FRG domain-containing protein [Tindallia californiensis]
MKQVTIRSFNEYIEFVEKYKGTHFFRGQANSEWEVGPNIFRDETKLSEECKYINRKLTDNSLEILSHILELQHYGNGTRLCDLTINPLVALYFSIEDDLLDNKDSAIFVFDESEILEVNSFELQVLLILTVKKIDAVIELQSEVKKVTNRLVDIEELVSIISKNYIINHNIKLSYSNMRALLQGGTGLFFGFESDGNIIKRKNNSKINSIIAKLIIPNELKSDLRQRLKNYGISKPVLYDDVSNNYKGLEYEVIEKEKSNNFGFNKLVLDIIVSDVVFVESEIQQIVSDVFDSTKVRFGSNSRIFIYVYYNEEDKRSFNWIARTENNKDFNCYNLKYNIEYHAKRMTYFNQEISVDTIFSKTEPITTLCLAEMKNAINYFEEWKLENITYEIYLDLLKQISKKIYNPIMYDLQDIYHGGNTYHNYYEYSDLFCGDVYNLVFEQITYLERNENPSIISWCFNKCLKACDSSYKKYDNERIRIKNSLSRL